MRPLWKGFALALGLVMLLPGCTSTSVNHPPSITAWEPRTDPVLPEEGNLTFEVTASDQDGQKLRCRWYLDGALSASTTGSQPFVYSYSPGSAAGNHTL